MPRFCMVFGHPYLFVCHVASTSESIYVCTPLPLWEMIKLKRSSKRLQTGAVVSALVGVRIHIGSFLRVDAEYETKASIVVFLGPMKRNVMRAAGSYEAL